MGMQYGSATLEDSYAIYYKMKNILPHASAVRHLDTYSNVLKTNVHTKTCIGMNIVALFIITKTWKGSRCPSTNE